MENQPPISSHYEFKIKSRKIGAHKMYEIERLGSIGQHHIFESLLEFSYIHHFRKLKPGKADMYGCYSGAIEYTDNRGEMCLLSLQAKMKAFNTGLIKSSISNDDCMLFRLTKRGHFEVYIIENAGQQADSIAYDYSLGLYEVAIRRFHLQHEEGCYEDEIGVDDNDCPF